MTCLFGKTVTTQYAICAQLRVCIARKYLYRKHSRRSLYAFLKVKRMGEDFLKQHTDQEDFHHKWQKGLVTIFFLFFFYFFAFCFQKWNGWMTIFLSNTLIKMILTIHLILNKKWKKKKCNLALIKKISPFISLSKT